MIKRRGGSRIENLTSDHKSLKSKGQMSSDWGVLYIVEKIFSKSIRHSLAFSKNISFEKYMNVESFGTTKIPILGVPGKSDIWT
jgi:hypothetical protein